MSDVEAYTGKLIPIDLEGKTLNDWCKEQLESVHGEDFELESYYSDYVEAYPEESYGTSLKEVHIDHTGGNVYEVIKNKLDPSDFLDFSYNADGSIDFAMSFYNGGASFGEVLQEIFD